MSPEPVTDSHGNPILVPNALTGDVVSKVFSMMPAQVDVQ